MSPTWGLWLEGVEGPGMSEGGVVPDGTTRNLLRIPRSANTVVRNAEGRKASWRIILQWKHFSNWKLFKSENPLVGEDRYSPIMFGFCLRSIKKKLRS